MASRTSNSRTNNAAEQRQGRYVQGGEVDRYPKRLGWWERKVLEKQDDDFTVTIDIGEDRRPDMVAARVYGSATLEWLVLQYNNIVDIQTEFLPGIELRLPSRRRVTLDIMTQSTGGNRIG